MKKPSNQAGYFTQYLSLVPFFAVVSISLAFTLWVLINAAVPDYLFSPIP